MVWLRRLSNSTPPSFAHHVERGSADISIATVKVKIVFTPVHQIDAVIKPKLADLPFLPGQSVRRNAITTPIHF
jgi:hypothetical protein